MIAETEMKNLVARKATVMLKCKRRKIPNKFSLAPMVGTIQWMEAHDFQSKIKGILNPATTVRPRHSSGSRLP